MSVDVELKCNKCQRETLATDGYWSAKCWVCGGKREVIKRYDHSLSMKEMEEAGFQIVDGGMLLK